MRKTMQQELKQRVPFACTEQEAFLSLVRTADVATRSFSEVLRPFGLTLTLYNILRILNGAQSEGGRTNREIAERLIAPTPDVTRLIDRLERAGLVERRNPEIDRRVVRTRISKLGEKLLESVQHAVIKDHKKRFGALGEKRLRDLCDVLDELRTHYQGKI